MTELHAHTTASDGMLTPEALVRLAAERGLTGLAITDHDTTEGYTEQARATARETDLTLIGGVEGSARAEREDVHLLGLGIDPHDRGLSELFDQLRAIRVDRGREILRRLEKKDIHLSWEAVQAEAGAVLTRPHVAGALVTAGHVADVREAFERFLARGRGAYVPLEAPRAEDWIAAIHAAGGIAILAHPGHGTRHRTVLDLVDQGLDGLEAWHPSHDDSLVAYYQELCHRLGRLAAGGSDFHGRYPEEADRLGTYMPPGRRAERLMERVM